MRPVLERLAQTPLNTAQGDDLPERAGVSRREEKVREKEVDPEAVKEHLKRQSWIRPPRGSREKASQRREGQPVWRDSHLLRMTRTK